jgi:hypothetical protein
MNDEQLRGAFAELRRAETAHVPSFRLRARARRPYLRFAFAIVLLIALAVVMIPRRAPQPSLSAWRAPTDFLLQTPGRELLHSVPDLKGTRQ